MKKQILLIVLLIGSIIFVHAQNLQLMNYGANSKMTVKNVSVNIIGSLKNDANATIVNDGTIKLLDTSYATNFINNSDFVSVNNSNVKLEGAVQDIGGTKTTTFANLFIDGNDNKSISIKTNINENLNFVANKIIIDDYDLVLNANAVITNASKDRFIVTNGIVSPGSLVKKTWSTSDFRFPVGDAINSYKPVTIDNSLGVADTFSVRIESGLNPITDNNPACVQYTYVIQESNAGGSNAKLKLGWNNQDQGNLFIPQYASIWQYTVNAWHIALGNPQGFNANDPVNETQWVNKNMTTGITDFSSSSNKFILRSLRLNLLQPIDTAICFNSLDAITFSAGDTGGIIQYQWQKNCNNTGWINLVDDATYQGVTTADLLVYTQGILPSDNCKYQCVLTSLMGTSTTAPINFKIHPLPQILASQDTTVFIGQPAQLDASGGVSYLWVPSTYLDYSDIQNPISTPAENISYVVFVTDTNGCVNSDTITISVERTSEIFVPDAFSPNKDGQNDVLYVYGQGIKDIIFIIYDRWGEKVFETTDEKTGWDGTYKGKELSKATFVYYVKVTYWDGNMSEKKGNVTLVK
ncbi:MAG: gliding motility-associated C-terminal domain-containing protein [Bacteroidetes bacterium]|nr:gliding motility-associated C-terminal domain-containing protein [Bacteroidota bacterium]